MTEIVIASAARTPVGSFNGAFASLSAHALGTVAIKAAMERAGVTEAWFVAGHWWDVAGAAYAGLRTGWVCRTDVAYPDAMPAPDVTGADVSAVAAAILQAG